MPANDALMQLVGGGQPQGTPTAGPTPMEESGAPVGAGMSTPQPNEGAQAQAQVGITMAMDLLEKALIAYGSESKEGGEILKSLSGLQRIFGAQRKESEGMIPAELRALIEQTGSKSPESQAAMGAGGAPAQAAPQQIAA